MDSKTVVVDCLKIWFIVNAAGVNLLRFIPPMIITQPEFDRLLEVLSHIFDRHAAQAAAH